MKNERQKKQKQKNTIQYVQLVYNAMYVACCDLSFIGISYKNTTSV